MGVSRARTRRRVQMDRAPAAHRFRYAGRGDAQQLDFKSRILRQGAVAAAAFTLFQVCARHCGATRSVRTEQRQRLIGHAQLLSGA